MKFKIKVEKIHPHKNNYLKDNQKLDLKAQISKNQDLKAHKLLMSLSFLMVILMLQKSILSSKIELSLQEKGTYKITKMSKLNKIISSNHKDK